MPVTGVVGVTGSGPCFFDTVLIHPRVHVFPVYFDKFIDGNLLLLGVSFQPGPAGWCWAVSVYTNMMESLLLLCS